MSGRRPSAGGEDPADPVGELRLAGGAGGLGLGVHQQVQRGIRRQALLRGAAVRRSAGVPLRQAGDRSVRRRARQRAALFGLARQPGCLPGLPQAGRQGDGAGAAHGWPPDPRLERLDHRPLLPVGAIRRAQGHRAHRLRRGPRPGQEGAPGSDLGRRHRLLARLGLRGHGRHRPRGRRPFRGGHRPHRRADRRRRAPLARAARGRGHDHDPQDPARPARRHDL